MNTTDLNANSSILPGDESDRRLQDHYTAGWWWGLVCGLAWGGLGGAAAVIGMLTLGLVKGGGA